MQVYLNECQELACQSRADALSSLGEQLEAFALSGGKAGSPAAPGVIE